MKKWSKEDTMLALYLHTQIEFVYGEEEYPLVADFANIIGRSFMALAAKIDKFYFLAHDDDWKNTELEKKVWAEYINDKKDFVAACHFYIHDLCCQKKVIWDSLDESTWKLFKESEEFCKKSKHNDSVNELSKTNEELKEKVQQLQEALSDAYAIIKEKEDIISSQNTIIKQQADEIESLKVEKDKLKIKPLPEELSTPEAMIRWKQLQDKGIVDEHYQPKEDIVKPELGYVAKLFAQDLKINHFDALFGGFWNMTHLSQAASKAKKQEWKKDIEEIFGIENEVDKLKRKMQKKT